MKYKIIIAEDESIIRNGIKIDIQNNCDYCEIVGEASNGDEAVDIIKEARPDIVLLDINMPILTGLKVLEKTNHLNYQAIIITGYDLFEYAQKSISMNVVDYLLKPVKVPQLVASIDKAIKNIRKNKIYLTEENIEMKEFFQNINLSNYQDPFSLKLEKYIFDNIENHISSESVSEYMEVSRSTLNEIIKERYNMTYNEYLTDLKLKYSLKLLETTDDPVYIVALKSGYKDYSYFSKIFKNKYGMTATKARNHFRKVMTNEFKTQNNR